MSAVLDEGAKVKTKTSPAVQCLATFLIGVFAGVCAVFVPRLGGLLVIQDMERITVFPAPFILLGMAYATIVGAIAAILYYEKAGTPGERFMTALGLPALLAGALSTTAHTNQVQKLQANTARLGDAVIAAENIKRNDEPIDLQPLSAPKPGVSGLRPEMLLGIGTAMAQTTAPPPRAPSSTNWTGLQLGAKEPDYAVLVYRAATAEQAEKKAAELSHKLPGVKAVKAGSGFAVMSSVKPESSAILEASSLKRELGLPTELVRVK